MVGNAVLAVGGYPRAVQRTDGKIVVAYYYDTDPNQERFIAATVVDV